MTGKSYSIEISNEAECDFDNSYQYYFADSPKVSDALFQRINISFESIKKIPFSFPEVYKNVRKFTVKKFPFVIYFQVGESTVKVIAIFHTSRNPEIWNVRVDI
jgi:plasmid stabilization system protein ParE